LKRSRTLNFKESRRLYKQWKSSQPDEESTTGGATLDGEPGAADSGLIAATTLEEA
jgi:hypothetical protein